MTYMLRFYADQTADPGRYGLRMWLNAGHYYINTANKFLTPQAVDNALACFSHKVVPQILPRTAFRHRCCTEQSTDHNRKGRPTVCRWSPGWQIRQGRRLYYDTSSARHDP